MKFSPIKSSSDKENVEMNLLFYPIGCEIPQHFREDEEVTLKIVSCGSECKMGPSKILLENVKNGQNLNFLPTQPNTIEVGYDLPLVVMQETKPRDG